jgi:outer membrane protein OmpA-like peptidoglycan-associated protein
MKTIRMTGWILAAALLSGPALADETFTNVGTQAQPLNQAGGTARAIGMGSAVVAVPQGSASLLWNPAALSTMTCSEVALHHNSGLGNSIQEILVVGKPLGKWGGVAAALNFVDNGTIDGRNDIAQGTSSYGAGDYGGSLGWGIKIFEELSAGVAVRGNWQHLAGQTYAAYSTDLGMMWNPISPLRLGVTYSNLGLTGKVAGYALNRGWRIGAGYDIAVSSSNALLLAASTERQDVGVQRVNLGVEDWIANAFALRAGYQWNIPNNQLYGWTGVTAGLGYRHGDFAFDYAFTPMGDLGNSHRFSATMKFGCPHDQNQRAAAPVARKAAPVVLASVVLADSHFDFDKSTLKPGTKTILDAHIKFLKEHPKATARVSGYTSAMGADDYNQKLSERRAQAVKNYLVTSGGIKADRITAVGRGVGEPAAFEPEPGVARSKAAKSNMRVLFEILDN